MRIVCTLFALTAAALLTLTTATALRPTATALRPTAPAPTLTTTTVDDGADMREHFTLFKEKFNKRYASDTEEVSRYNIFRTNAQHVFSHNLNEFNHTYKLAINKFSDLSPSEFKVRYAGGLHWSASAHRRTGKCSAMKQPSPADNAETPPSIDWRTVGAVNPVRDQGQCGSCWAFATTANAESVWAISSKKLFDFSEQYLVDCATGLGYFNMGCNGGQPDSAFKYMINNGVYSEVDYPYTSGVTKTSSYCHADSEDISSINTIMFQECVDVTPNDQNALRFALTKRPVVVAIEADTKYFQSYSSGILTDYGCGTELDHAVMIVGYGVENGQKYWTVRNSWGEEWGENGYVRIARSDSSDDAGVCGIAMEPSFIVADEESIPD